MSGTMNIKLSKLFLPVFFLLPGLVFCCADDPGPAWTAELNYQAAEIHPLSLNWVHEPLVPVKIDGVEFQVVFDTGCSKGFSLTNAVEDKINCPVTGTATEYNADGSYRGKSKIIKIKEVEIFGEFYRDITTTLADWKMYGSVKFNGLLGLKYFRNKRVTLDYKNKKLAISERPVLPGSLDTRKYLVLPLLAPPVRHGDLVYFKGEVNGQKSVIYLDTGSSRSFVDVRVLKEHELPKEEIPERKRKSKLVKLKIAGYPFEFNNIRIKKIERGTNFDLPVRFKIGADILKNFSITIDKIDQRLIIHRDNLSPTPN